MIQKSLVFKERHFTDRRKKMNNNRKYKLAVTLAMVMVVLPAAAACVAEWQSNSTADAATDFTGYIPISTPSDLAKIGNDLTCPLDGKYYLTNDINFTGTATNASGGNFNPIGSYATPFTGIFDGNNHVISGMNIVATTVTIDPYLGHTILAGLFSYAMGAHISNLGIVNGSVSATTGDTDVGVSAGSIVGAIGLVIVGMSDQGIQTSQTTQIINCYNTGDVSATSSDSAYAGGIVGDAGGTFDAAGDAQIINCYNMGSVTAMAMSESHCNGTFAGGIVGTAGDTQIIDCYNTGSITAKSTFTVSDDTYDDGGAAAGGIAGDLGISDQSKVNTGVTVSQIINCYNTGSVTASLTYNSGISSVSTMSLAGGITGWFANYYSYPAWLNCQITDCYNTGSVAASVTSQYTTYCGAGGVYGGYGVSGGYAQGSITNCYFLTNNIAATVDGILFAENSMGNANFPNDTSFTPIIDGNDSGTSRTGNQGTGAYTEQQMKPTLTNAKNGNSIYYTGTTTVGSSTVSGWDFNNTWTIVPGTNNGYPILSSLSNSHSGSSESSDDGGGSGTSGSGSSAMLYAGVAAVIVIIGAGAVFFLHKGGKI